MEFKLKDTRPIWQQLADQMTESIITGEFSPGERFPSVRDLAVQAGVNPNTMQRALAKMEESGLLVTARTSGRTVTEDEDILRQIRRMLAEERVKEYLEDMEKLGFSAAVAAEYAVQSGKGDKNVE